MAETSSCSLPTASPRRALLAGRYNVFRPAIGSGSFAKVYRATDIRSGEAVAIKSINRAKLSGNPKLEANLESEIDAMTRLAGHPNIVSLHESLRDSKHIRLVLEFCPGRDLSAAMTACRRTGRPFPETLALKLLRQLATGLAAMRKHRIIHRDLKPQNLLLSSTDPETAVLKIADFGFARLQEDVQDEMMETLCGSPLYMAPEVLLGQGYDRKADLWSVGVILFEMLTGEVPFPGQNTADLKRLLLAGRYSFPPHVTISKACIQLIEGLLTRDPGQRITFKEFFTHPLVACTAPEGLSDDLLDFEVLDYPCEVLAPKVLFAPDATDHAVVDTALALERLAGAGVDRSVLVFGMEDLSDEWVTHVGALALRVEALGLLKTGSGKEAAQAYAMIRDRAQMDYEAVVQDPGNSRPVDCIALMVYQGALGLASAAAIDETMEELANARQGYMDAYLLLRHVSEAMMPPAEDKEVLEAYAASFLYRWKRLV